MNERQSRHTHPTAKRPAPLRRRVFSLPSLLMFAIFAAFVYFLLTRFDPNWRDTLDTIRRMNFALYLLGFALYYTSFFLRGQRWRILARNTGELDAIPSASLPSMWAASSYILIGWFVNSISWLRMGDGYRAWLFARGSGGGFSWSLGTLFAERVLDVASMLLILVACALVLLFSAASPYNAALIVVLLTAVAVVGLTIVLLAMRMWGRRLARFLPSRLEAEFHRFQTGTLGSLKQMPTVIALGCGAWLLEVARLFFVVQALGLDAPLVIIAIAALSAAILSTVPIPGGVGFVESGIIGILLLALSRPEAVSIALVDRSITFISVIAVGGAVFLASQIWQRRRRRSDCA